MTDHFSEAARSLALGLAELDPLQPALILRVQYGAAGEGIVRVTLSLESEPIAAATAGRLGTRTFFFEGELPAPAPAIAAPAE